MGPTTEFDRSTHFRPSVGGDVTANPKLQRPVAAYKKRTKCQAVYLQHRLDCSWTPRRRTTTEPGAPLRGDNQLNFTCSAMSPYICCWRSAAIWMTAGMVTR